ncbi:MAG TPA: helix-turn-helix domain-containing protein [Methylocella sp.]
MELLSDHNTGANERPLAYHLRPWCKLVGICPSTAYKYISSGKIKVVRIGGRTLIPASESDRILAEGVH